VSAASKWCSAATEVSWWRVAAGIALVRLANAATGDALLCRRDRDDGIACVYGWELTRAIRNGHSLSRAGFGRADDIGNSPSLRDRDHGIGPLVGIDHKRDDKRTLNIETGLLFALTPATPYAACKPEVRIKP
jgi:hypothetical protein